MDEAQRLGMQRLSFKICNRIPDSDFLVGFCCVKSALLAVEWVS